MATGKDQDGDTGTRSDLLAVVGIGASAGGLTALRELFGHMPPDTGLVFVVVMHLSPEHESHLPDLLQAHTQMPVRQVTETLQMEPNHVYVIPPGSNLTAVDTHLRLSEMEKERSRRAPIDHFFQTLAKTYHETAVGVVLTGTGSDGTFGLRKIREESGLTIAQDPAEAEHDTMPMSAISHGVADRVLPLSEMPDQIVRFATTEPAVPVPEEDEDVERDERQTILDILTQVRARTSHDFSRYKPATVMRRIRRRMQIHQMEDLEEYGEHVRRDRDEARQLFDDLLITVTNFFRDPETFEVLERDVVPKLFEDKAEQDQVRAWSVGCATGEEAYSLAILLLEHASRLDPSPQVQVFATDLHEASLESAREGLYPDTMETQISPERLERFFAPEYDHYYRVRPQLREAVVFAPHNVIKDPPFSHLDLVSCRNMLIYLRREVQEEILPLFHYALRPGGYLLLGSSETIRRSKFFERIDEPHRIYLRRELPAHEPRLPVFSMPPARFARRDPDVPRRPQGAPGYGALHQKMVEQYAPPSVLVGEDNALVHASARAGRYLKVPGGEPTNDLFRLVREPLRLGLRAGLFAVRDRGKAYRSRPIRLEVEGEPVHVTVRVQPPGDDDELEDFCLVIFDEGPTPPPGEVSEADVPEGTARELEEELVATRARLQAMREDQEASQQEMRATNEELQSMNEELRSAMEELETSKEELQSMNEELATANQENRHKVEELAQLSSDLQNLLSATEIATLFLDRDLRIMRFTPPLTELFHVRPTDRGRPLSDLTHRLDDVDLEKGAEQVLDSLAPLTHEIQSDDGRWLLTRILPYRSTEDRIEGVVITFVDITERKATEEALRASEERYRTLFNSIDEGFCIIEVLFDKQGEPFDYRFLEANPAFVRQTGLEDPVGRTMREFAPNHEEFWYEAYAEIVRTGEPRRFEHEAKALGFFYEVYAFRIDEPEANRVAVLFRDITERKRTEEALRESEERFRAVSNLTPDLLWRSDPNGSTSWYNQRWTEYTGQTLEEAVGWGWLDVIHPDHREKSAERYRRAVEEGERLEQMHRIRRHDGEYRWFLVRAEPLLDDYGAVRHFFGSATDIHEQWMMLEELEERVSERTREVRELSLTLTMAEQEERRRIARVLHDDIQQLLFGLHLRLDYLSGDMAELEEPELQEAFGEARDWIDRAIEGTRELSVGLNPPVLKDEGLCEALRWLASQMRKQHQLEVDLRFEDEVAVDDEDARSLLFQTVRELLFNVVKHADVDEATVSLRREGDSLELQVSDEGAGFDPGQVRSSRSHATGLGLFSVRERIRLIGGEVSVDAAPGQGTRVRVTVPLDAPGNGSG